MGKYYCKVGGSGNNGKFHSVSQATAAAKHNAREAHCENVDKKRSHLNQMLLSRDETFAQFFKKKLKECAKANGPKKAQLRSNAVRAFDLVVSVKADEAEQNPLFDLNDFGDRVVNYMKWKLGEGNIYSIALHMDEEGPHIHVLAVPMTEDKRICYRDLLGEIPKFEEFLSGLQDELKLIGLEQEKRRVKYNFRTHDQFKQDVIYGQSDTLPYPEPYETKEEYCERANREHNRQKSFLLQQNMDKDVKIVRLQEENARLKEENDALKSTPAEQRNEDLRKENEELKEKAAALEGVQYLLEHRDIAEGVDDELLEATLQNLETFANTGLALKAKVEAEKMTEVEKTDAKVQ